MKKALVIIDMQNDFITGPLGNAHSQAIVPNIVQILRNNSYNKIIFTRDTHTDNYQNTQEGKNLPIPHCIQGSKGWQIIAPLIDAVGEHDVIDKNTFGSIALAYALTGYPEIDLVGVCTGICVISNALIIKAVHPEAHISVIKSATACITPQSKETALEAMKLCQINII